MIGYTNSTASKPMPGEYINVRLLTNQSSHSDLNGIAFTVEYEGYSKDYVWEGSEVTVLIPADMEYTVKFKDVEGYKTPESITYTAVAENARDIEVLYQCELLTVNVSADNGSVSEYEITIYKQETVGVATKYTKLEYIESNGTQYIDTGFNPNQNTKMYLDVAFLSSVGTNVAGVRNSASDTTNRFGIISFGSTSKIGAFFRDSSIQSIAYDTLRHEYELSKSGLVVDGTSYGSANSGTFSCTYPITLGAWNNGEGGISYNNSRIYGCKIYDNGTLVRDYIPTLRSDGIAGLYDAVNDAFYASNGTGSFVAGTKVESVVGVQTTAVETYKIPFGVSYTVSASSVDGYVTPAIQIFVAEESIKNVDIVYITHSGTKNPSIGIYIQDTDGYFHTEAEWDSTYTPNGVAVITSKCRFVIALENAHSSTCMWGGYGKSVSGIVTTSSEITAAKDYTGESNTTTIINALNGVNDGYVTGAPAAEYCRAYEFPDGSIGYLGAAGEWQAALDNKAAITSALSKCGGASMNSSYWTSTQSNSVDFCWIMVWSGGYLNNGATKRASEYVRAFCSDNQESGGGDNNLISFTIDDTSYQAWEGMTWGEWVDSEYNTGGYYIDSDDSILNQVGNSWIGTSEYYVFSQDVIQEGYTYTLVG